MTKVPALVFGASGEQGRAVVEGLVDKGYSPVYAFTRNSQDRYLTDGLGAKLMAGELQNPNDVRKALEQSQAQAIFLVTTTDMPTGIGQTSGFKEAAEIEFEAIAAFFRTVKAVHEQDGLSRHVVYSTCDNVQRKALDEENDTSSPKDDNVWILPLDDGSIVPNFSAKGRGGEYGIELLRDTPGVKLTLITIPFLYSNFLGFFTPLPNKGRTQWELSACFGDGENKIDMMGAMDLSVIVPNIFDNPDKYNGQNIRLVGEQISMDEVASIFADLYGRDVIYNPLTFEEVCSMRFPAAPAMAQMCQFLGDPRGLRHDMEATLEVCFPKKPQAFKDWLLTHSDSTTFQEVGLDIDAPEIMSVTVFGATSPEGTSVVKGLLADQRKMYKIRATTRHTDSSRAKALAALDSERVEVVYTDLDDLVSCSRAVEGMDGAFLVTDFYNDAARDMEAEERHAKNVIDACEASTSVKHLVFSTMESIEEMNRILELGLNLVQDAKGREGTVVQFDAKARAAAYARTKRLSVTYVLLPCYSELFFDLIERRRCSEGGSDKFVMTIPLKDDAKVMCMSVDDLGPAVANIFDSYQVYAGHEIGLVTDIVTPAEVKNIIQDVFFKENEQDVVLETKPAKTTTGETEWHGSPDAYMKDLGQMFAYMAHTDAVKMRRSVAKTMKLLPSARPLRQWVEQNVDKEAFREKLGLS